MPRKPRFNLPGIPQHIIQRGNNREPCFYSEKDYRQYLDDLKESASKYDCRIHAYVLMTNHVHLLVTPMIENGVSQMMQSLGRRYVKYFNHSNNRTGTLWEGRFKSSLIDSDIYLLTCMCYIELNPVRARMVEHPAEYKWSSYQKNAQMSENAFIDYHPIYMTLGETSDERMFVYRELFQRHLDDDTIHQIRDALNHELVLGRSYFKDKIEEITNRQTRLGRPGRPCVKEGCAEYYIFN
jgi:putative transposase